MPLSPLRLGAAASVGDGETALSQAEQRGGSKARHFERLTDLSAASSTEDGSPMPDICSRIQRRQPHDQRCWNTRTSTAPQDVGGLPTDAIKPSTWRQVPACLQLPLGGAVGDHENQANDHRHSALNTDDSTSPDTSTTPSRRRRRLSVDICSSTGRRCRRLDQRRSTAPLPHQIAVALRLARPPKTATSASVDDPRSPRVLRHLCALNSPGKKHWTPVERLCCEVRATEEDYVSDLRRLTEGFFAPLAGRAADAGIPLSSLSELHAATQFLLRVHEELLAQMSSGRSPCDESQGNASGSATGCEHRSQADANASTDEGEDGVDDDGTHPNQRSHEPPRVVRSPPVSANKIARAFVGTAQFMKAYALYCAAHRPATDELNALHKKHPWLLLDLGTSMGPTEADLEPLGLPEVLSELIKPVQRICRYPMLLRSLVDQSMAPSSSVFASDEPEDAALLRQALDDIELVSDLVNARVRDAQNNARLLELFAALPESGKRRAAAAKVRLLRPARTFVSEAYATVSVTRSAPRWCWLRALSSLLMHLHLPHCFRSEVDTMEVRESDIRERLAECGHCDRGYCLPPSATNCGDLYDGSDGPIASDGGRGEQSRLVLLSDVLLMAKKCVHKLQIRRQICLSCATVSEPDGTPRDGPDEPTLLLVAAKVGRCHCHQLSPAALQHQPPSKRPTSTSASLVDTTAAAIGSSNAPWHRAVSSPFRATRRYLLRFDSAGVKAEFAAQLREAIAKNARVEPPAPQTPRASRASKRRAVQRLWRSLTHTELSAAMASTASNTRATPVDTTVDTTVDTSVDTEQSNWPSRALDGLLQRRHVSLAAATGSNRHEADSSSASSAGSTDTSAAIVRVTDSLDGRGDLV